jgi:hypothetical protein
MNNTHSQKIAILKGEVSGVVIPPTDRLVKNQRYWDRKNLPEEEFMKKWSPYHNPNMRLNDEQIAQHLHDAKLFADMYNANQQAYKGLMK